MTATTSLSNAITFIREQADHLSLPSGERVVEHALGTVQIIKTLNVDPPTLIAAALFPMAAHFEIPQDQLNAKFGEEVMQLVANVCKLTQLSIIGEKAANAMTLGVFQRAESNLVQAQAQAQAPGQGPKHPDRDIKSKRRAQVEALRKMLLAFAQDVRIVLIQLASRLQTLRYHAATKTLPAAEVSRETLDLYTPLANRLGLWQLKWELEDLAFRFEDPATYKRIAQLLDEKRIERESFITEAINGLQHALASQGIRAQITGRPKHIYSIWRKMRGKKIDFSDLYDMRAFRLIVSDLKDCYAALGIVHHIWQPIPKEFDDYISRPKPNGYQSLHTVVLDEQARALEIQIRTHEMHRFAEYGVAAHWRYKEAGEKGYRGQFAANGQYDEKIAWLRQLLAWKQDIAQGIDTASHSSVPGAAMHWAQFKQTGIDDHIYVLTPQARVIELPQGATAVDFAYHVHTELGHRCRGVRVEGTMVPLNTPLQNGQTVEIIAVKQGGPSRDWLNPQHGYLKSARAKQKVRAWFNAIEVQENISTPQPVLSEALVNKAAEPTPTTVTRKSSHSSVMKGASSGVLVLGVGALMTQFARCCRPVPPDAIAGFITRGRGISIHREHCSSFLHLAKCGPERVVQTAWADVPPNVCHASNARHAINRSDASNASNASSSITVYPVDILIEAVDRQGLLRDISEVFAREKINIIDIKSTTKHHIAIMRFTVEVSNAARLRHAIILLGKVSGILGVKRKGET